MPFPNEILKNKVIQQATNSIIEEALKPEVFGKNLTGRFEFQPRLLYTDITDAGFEMEIKTTIWADRREYYEDLIAILFINPDGDSIKTTKALVSQWQPIFNPNTSVHHEHPYCPVRD